MMLIALLAIVLLIISFFAKIPGGVKWAGFVFAAVLLQWVIGIVVLRGRRGSASCTALNALPDRLARAGVAAKQADVVGDVGACRSLRRQ